MLVYAVDEAAAFELLRRYSQQVNVKVRDVARQLVESASTSGGWPSDVRAMLDRLALQAPPAVQDENPGA
jgi:hypothetical protein